MFPCAFDEAESAGVNHEGIGRILMRKIVPVQVVSSFSLKLTRTVPLNRCDRKICYHFIRNDQIKGATRKIKFGRVLLEMPALREKFRQDLSLVLHQRR